MIPEFVCFYGTQSEFINGFSIEDVNKGLSTTHKPIVSVSINNYNKNFRIDQSLRQRLNDISSANGIPLTEVVVDGSRYMPDSVKKLFSDHPDHMDITRRNIIEMVDSAIFSFLKLSRTGRFESTEIDSIFHAKHDLLLGMLPDIEKGWRDICDVIYQEISKSSQQDSVIVMNLELRYAIEPRFR